MDTIKVVLADDDAGMRLVVRHMLERVEGFTLVGEAADGDALLEVRRVQEHVVVPEGVKYITEGAFWMPNKDSTLKTLQLPQSLVSIGKNAFAGNTGLQSVVVPENVTEIGTQAFNGCSAMTSAVVKGNVTELNGTFGGCSALASVTLPDTVESMAGMLVSAGGEAAGSAF